MCSIVAIQEKKHFSIKHLVFYYYVGQSLTMTGKATSDLLPVIQLDREMRNSPQLEYENVQFSILWF